ncbi:MAG: hypothetical protein KatS3mg002_0247 [Candidatus Woesearchaeota archaeon]|nr:MAG: hypothetical protein KatS3mg002_0247 [Candidatus Woesearchaeota archaeon]
MRIVIVGLGGIGTFVVDYLCRFANYSPAPPEFLFIDGDSYEEKNKNRQTFEEIEGLSSKAGVKRVELMKKFPNLKINAINEYLTHENFHKYIQNEDVIFICVDNHKTRYLIATEAESFDNIVIINGGNELYDGNVQLYVRKGGENLTCTLYDYHPEIGEPQDKHPLELSCQERQLSSPQLLFTNMLIANVMLIVFYQYITNDFSEFKNYFEWYLDIRNPLILDAKIRQIKS